MKLDAQFLEKSVLRKSSRREALC